MRIVRANRSTIVKPSLRKGMKVQFKLKDSDKITSATILSRSGKAKGIYKNAWNIKLSDGTIISTGCDRDISSFVPSPT